MPSHTSLEYFHEQNTDGATTSPLDIKGQWKRIDRSQLNFGFTQDVVWIRFNIDPQDYGSSQLLLEVASHKIDQLDLFVYDWSDTGPILKEQFHVGDHLSIVDTGFDRNSIAGLTEAPIIEEYPISISNLQLSMIRRLGFSPMRPEKQIKNHGFSEMKILVLDDHQGNLQVVSG